MGNDGGSIPTRRELVKEAARNRTTSELKESRHEQQEYYWTTDPISHRSLAQPVVSDSTGNLYNKDTILEYLIEGGHKEEADRVTKGTIKSLKDVVEVKFETIVDISEKANGSARHEIWKCPVTGEKLGPGSKAVYLVPCGHAFSGTAIKEVSGEKCLTCEIKYASNDIIPILSTTPEDMARLSLRMEILQEKGLTHSLKKASGSGKKRKKKAEPTADSIKDGEVSNGSGNDLDSDYVATPMKGSKESRVAGINNSSTASLTKKVLEEQQRSKKRKGESENVRRLFSADDSRDSTSRDHNFMTRGFSLATGERTVRSNQ